jgi:hypothetical protein
MIKCADYFYAKHNRYPGQVAHEEYEKDINIFADVARECLANIVDKLPFDIDQIRNDYVHEIVRFSNSRIMMAVSIISSIAAQEIIKLITYQFKTINNTLIYDGIHSHLSIFNV